ncbi:SLC13 family permease [Opitutales bacterium]|nr:SLC13 family permease [Opitutales bacterium]MDA8991550.1 SLC13 family permease [Opitutales bacterium]
MIPFYPALAVSSHSVSPGVTYLFFALLVCMVLCLALEEKIHAKKSVIVGLFAIIALFLGSWFHLLPFEDVGSLVIGGHKISLPVYIPGVDWEVIAIILGSSLFVDVTSKSGLFTWVAVKLTKLSKGDPLRLLILYGVMTVVFSAVLNNVTAMIIVGSLTGVSLKKLNQSEKLLGFLLVEGLLTNIGGLLTLISSVPNIIVGKTAGIEFVDFFIKAAPYVVVATIVTLWLGSKLFKIQSLKTEEERISAQKLISGFDETEGIESPGFFRFGALMTFVFIGTVAMTSQLPVIKELGLGFVALAFAGIMLVRYKAVADRFYKAIDWDLLFFFVCLFAVINVMEHALVLNLIGEWLMPILGLGDSAGPAALLVASAAASSVTDNIPLAAMLAKILGAIPEMASNPDSPYWWAVIFGANLGGNITPIGSASTLVSVTIIHKYGLNLSFAGFVKVALPYAVIQLALGVVYLLVTG